MSAAITSLIQRSLGLPSVQHEINTVPKTQAHSSTHGGLRGHSIGDTYPYRVVGKGDGTWEVHRSGSPQRIKAANCEDAHEWARTLRRQLDFNNAARHAQAAALLVLRK